MIQQLIIHTYQKIFINLLDKNMKDIKEFLNITNQTEEIEEINENAAEIIVLTSYMITIICQLMVMTGFAILGNEEGMFDSIKYWWRDKKVKKIAKRLAEDSDVKAFLAQPKSKQKGWKKLIETKLSDKELKYIHSISRNKVSDKIN